EPAELAYSPLHRLRGEPRVTDIHRDTDTSPSLGHDRAQGLLRVLPLLRERRDRHVGAFTIEEQGHGAPDPGIAPGHERHAPLELLGAAVVRRLVARPRTHLRLEARRLEVLLGEGGLRTLPCLLAHGSPRWSGTCPPTGRDRASRGLSARRAPGCRATLARRGPATSAASA